MGPPSEAPERVGAVEPPPEPPVRVVLAGGGTGGHLFPGLALAEALTANEGEAEVLFLGAVGGIEQSVLPRHGYPWRALDAPRTSGSAVRTILSLPRLLWRLARARAEALAILEEFGAEVVAGLGGYAQAPAVLAARGRSLPVVLLEQNAIPGRATRLLARRADEILLSFEAARECLPARARARARTIGNPVRSAVRALAGRPPGEGGAGPRLLVVGGSQGAQRLNEIAAEILPALAAKVEGLAVDWVAGPAGAAAAREALGRSRVPGDVFGFCDRMDALYARSSVAFSRAGATTLAELACAGVPAVLVPYPFAADDHQAANARFFEAPGAAEVLRQEEAAPGRVLEVLARILREPERRARMAAAARTLARPEAAAEAAEAVRRLARGRRAEE